MCGTERAMESLRDEFVRVFGVVRSAERERRKHFLHFCFSLFSFL